MVCNNCSVKSHIGRKFAGKFREPLDTRSPSVTVEPCRVVSHIRDAVPHGTSFIVVSVPDHVA